MRYFGAILALCLIPRIALATPFVTVAGQARLPVVAGWEVVGDTSAYPLQLVSTTGEAELLVYRSDIERTGAVDNSDQLRNAADDVIDDVILTLPDARMVSSEGYYENNHTGFILEFTSWDSVAEATLHHRLKTALFRTDEGNQIMFTIWGKGVRSTWEYSATPIEYMQEEFEFLGEHRLDVFDARGSSPWPYIILAMALTATYLLVRKRRKQAEAEAAAE
jgi:hypothetical protein